MYLYALLAIGAVFCAYRAISAKRLLHAAMWLASTSAIVSGILYMLGAHEIAVIELSVGAGLVTILFVFALSIAGEEGMKERPTLPRPISWAFVLLALYMMGRMTLPLPEGELPLGQLQMPSSFFASIMWGLRRLDVLVQIFLILLGVLGAVGLLTDARNQSEKDAEPEAQEQMVTGEVQS